MSDRLALTEAIEDGGVERSKAVRIATVIFDAIHQTVATKADVQAEVASLRDEMRQGFAAIEGRFAAIDGQFAATDGRFARLDSAMEGRFARQDVAIERLRSTQREMENRITLRLGGIVAAGVAIIVALQHLWPVHG